MVFAGIPFLFYFLPLLLGTYYAVPQRYRWGRNAVLLIASLLFYAWGEGGYLVLLLVSIGINHLCAQRLNGAHARVWLVGGIVANLLVLSWFKYAGFIASGIGLSTEVEPHLPLGISFFTFQAISYLADIARKEAEPSRRIDNTALYIASFPQLIAGPIVRFKTIAAAITDRRETVAGFAEGIRLFLLGLGQKVLLANLAAGPVDAIFAVPTAQLTTAVAWAGIGAYSLQIFFDFAGYSNMAMGLGLMVGFRFPRNFDFPYMTRSVTAFWRHWHMTLSTWFRDYLYIPLGGSKNSTIRTIINLWIVFLLCGLWHGAAWNFILWGAFHGGLLTIERLAGNKISDRLPAVFSHVYLLGAITLSWVLFRAETVDHAVEFYGALFFFNGVAGPGLNAYFEGNTAWFIVASGLFVTPLPKRIMASILEKLPLSIAQGTLLFGFVSLFVLCGAFLVGGTYSPFLYFRF